MRLYIIRHADPDYANNTITPAGHAEGRALAAYLQTLGVDEIYSSPLGRAIDTARYTADLLNQPIRIEPWLQELGELWIEDLQMVFWNYDSYLFRSNEILADLNHWRNYPPLDNQRVSQNLERVGRESDIFVERQGFVRQLLSDGRIGPPGHRAYYEVCTDPQVSAMVQALLVATSSRD